MPWTTVAPFAGAWIEIIGRGLDRLPALVAPFTGAWIEMTVLPVDYRSPYVAPFTGAWIEIAYKYLTQMLQSGRSLHGSVD